MRFNCNCDYGNKRNNSFSLHENNSETRKSLCPKNNQYLYFFI